MCGITGLINFHDHVLLHDMCNLLEHRGPDSDGFYENKNVPKLVILNHEIKDKKLIEKTLSLKENKNISITIAKKGSKANVVSLAEKNAKESLNRKLYETNNNKNLFEGISKKFNLKNNISLVEVYDNSHIQGTSSVGAMVTFGDEGFIKKRYRKFDIKTKNSEQDDYAMLREVLNRRFKRAILKKENYLTFPDLLLIDGGKGQYSTAREVLNELGLYDIPIIAIAKGKLRNSGNETFFYNGKIFKFEKNDPTLFFLQRLRDEAHRFAINAHRVKRQKGIRRSLLDQINGIGSIRKRSLLNHFGSAKAVESASFDEIKSVKGVEEKVAKKIMLKKDIDFTIHISSDENSISITSELKNNISSEYNLVVCLTENNIINWQKDGQNNVEDYQHNHVLRSVIYDDKLSEET